jgi:thiamine transporter
MIVTHAKGVFRIMSTKLHRNIRALCEGAILIALAQILSYIKLFPNLPNGGSITFAMFPIVLFAVRWGVSKGLMAGFTFGLLQLIFDGAYAWGWESMLLDYLVAFTPLGLAGAFKGKSWGIFPGTILGCAARFAVHFLSGVTVWNEWVDVTALPASLQDTWIAKGDALIYSYSFFYNGATMLPEIIITVVLSAIVWGALSAALKIEPAAEEK